MMLFFDVGETLASEGRWLGSWADWLGVPRSTFFAALGALIEARRPHQELFPLFRPGIDVAAERDKRSKLGISDHFTLDDLYPDRRLVEPDRVAAAGVEPGELVDRAVLVDDELRADAGRLAERRGGRGERVVDRSVGGRRRETDQRSQQVWPDPEN